MGTVASTIEQWAANDPKKEALYTTKRGLIVSYINDAQLTFVDKSECLRGVWQPTITSSGSIALPSDFLREIVNRVKWSSTVYLTKMDYPTANLVTSFGSTLYYSIWNGTFYVWAAASGTPDVPYIKKPTAITATTLSSADLDIPTEFHHRLQTALDSYYLRTVGDYKDSEYFDKKFEQEATQAGMDFRDRNDPVPIMRGSFF